jgi:hypothetical protein
MLGVKGAGIGSKGPEYFPVRTIGAMTESNDALDALPEARSSMVAVETSDPSLA